MSFGDITRGNFTGAQKPAKAEDDVGPLSNALQSLQRDCQTTKVAITSMRRRKIGPSEKHELDCKIKAIKEAEVKLKKNIDSYAQKVESMPRAEAASKRTVMGKMQKDYERLRVNVSAIVNESALVKVVNERGEAEAFSRTGGIGAPTGLGLASSIGGGSGGSGAGGAGGGGGGGGGKTVFTGKALTQAQQAQEQQQNLQLLMSGREVDDAILEERERDIKRVNQDLVLVNEMFKDMAQLVENQGSKVNEIAVSADKSHDRAKAGLEQVNHAAEYQPGCAIS